MMRNRFWFGFAVLGVLAFTCAARAQVVKTANGTCGPLFGAKVCTSYQMRAGKIAELVLRVPIAAIEHAPKAVPMEWPPKPDLIVPFSPVVAKQTGFTYASIYWEAHGHPPGVYMVPHFDLHFYFAPERKIEAIDCKDTVKPRALPAGYALPDANVPPIGEMVGLCIPDMGMHAIPTVDLHRKAPWKASMMAGYYGGKPIFLEPMITSALLLQKRSFSLPVPRGVAPVPHVRYPRKFEAVYLPKSKAYDFTLFY